MWYGELQNTVCPLSQESHQRTATTFENKTTKIRHYWISKHINFPKGKELMLVFFIRKTFSVSLGTGSQFLVLTVSKLGNRK